MNQLRSLLDSHQADAVLLSFLPDIRWACGFSGSNGILYVDRNEAHFISDGRYTAQARREVTNAEVHTPGYDLLGFIEEKAFFDDEKTVLFQSDHVTVDQIEEWRERFSEIEWKGVAGLLQEHVAQKTDEEIARMRSAQGITDEVFGHLLDFIEPGMAEKDVAAEAIYQHLRRGADEMSFDPIVASGSNGSLPHARPSDRPIEEGELLVIDMGCFKDGYASDMTRTIAIGEPGDEARAAYEAVLKAQKSAIDAAHANMTGKELDAVARGVLKEEGFGDYFTHGLGHGVGLQIHEWPKLSYHVEHKLPERAAVTVEPGVYVPEAFGIRIEDILILSENGCENITGSPKELIVL